MEVYIASKNAHKVQEYRKLLKPLGWSVLPLPDDIDECPENAHSFEANAMEKAVFYSRTMKGWVLADDSGLSVPELNGEPGVRSARYAGEHGDDSANNRKLLQRLDTVPNDRRTAFFICSIALWNDQIGTGLTVRGQVEGTILRQPSGQSGFGYDPLFFYAPLGKSFADLSMDEKNEVSHRRRAVQALSSVWEGGVRRAFVRSE
ncbi:RdgB/HAM1 family non-canonical purine NTP pyrophosphatase [Alicyclobacillus sp. SO9]|nr:RdgB/HAM1 family non-canonical purine NTP pyrophosphatase [Alicyclobacillus sp. SO9]